MPDAIAILRRLAFEHVEARKWDDAPLEVIKWLLPPAIGAVGEGFCHEMCGETGLQPEFPMSPAGRRQRNWPWDILINGRTFEIKTATLGDDERFQFNNVRIHQKYDALPAIGISPENI